MSVLIDYRLLSFLMLEVAHSILRIPWTKAKNLLNYHSLMERNHRSNITSLAGFGFLLLLWIILFGAAPIGKKAEVIKGLEGEGQVELLHHDLTIELIPDQHLLKARDSLTFTSISPN